MKIGFNQLILSTVLASSIAPAALAQSADNPFQRGRYTPVAQRPQPEFDPEAVRAGAFEIWSRLNVGADYNNNIFATENNADDDTIIRVRPEVDIRSGWSTHALNAGVAIDHKEYLNFDSETTTSYSAYVGGRVDVQRTFNLRGRIDASHVTEPRYEPSGVSTGDPVQYDRIEGQVGADFRTDRFRLEGDVGQRDDDFDGAANSFRDVTDTWAYGRASYAASPNVAVFLQGRSSDLDYNPPTTGNPNRDGTRSSVQVGVNFELQAPFAGEIAIGQVQDEKDDPTQTDIEGLSLDGRLQWFLTELTTATFQAHRGVFDPGIQQVSNAIETTYGIRVDHELRRNIIVFAEVNGGNYDFEGYDREDEFIAGGFGIGYKLNKNMRLNANYNMHTRTSSGTLADRNLDQNILSISLSIFP